MASNISILIINFRPSNLLSGQAFSAFPFDQRENSNTNNPDSREVEILMNIKISYWFVNMGAP